MRIIKDISLPQQ